MGNGSTIQNYHDLALITKFGINPRSHFWESTFSDRWIKGTQTHWLARLLWHEVKRRKKRWDRERNSERVNARLITPHATGRQATICLKLGCIRSAAEKTKMRRGGTLPVPTSCSLHSQEMRGATSRRVSEAADSASKRRSSSHASLAEVTTTVLFSGTSIGTRCDLEVSFRRIFTHTHVQGWNISWRTQVSSYL